MSLMRKAVAGHSRLATFIVDLSEFPAGEKIGTREHIDLYDVADGIHVLAYDDARCRVVPARVSQWSVHHDREVVLVNLLSGLQIVSDDDPRAVYGLDPETFEMVRRRPAESVGTLVPVAHRTVSDVATDELHSLAVGRRSKSKEIVDYIPLDRTSGYFIGALAGDGWVSDVKGVPRFVNFAVTDEGVRGRLQEIVAGWRDGAIPEILFGRDAEASSYGESARITINSTPLAELFGPLVGKGADNKHLPAFFLNAGEEFRLGLLAGLMDTDGTICVCDKGTRTQTAAAIQSNSIRLIMEVQHLCRSFGVRAHMSAAKTPAGKPCWLLSISWVDLQKLPLQLFHTDKRRIFMEAPAALEDSGPSNRSQMIPMSESLARACRSLCDRKTADGRSLYDALTGAIVKHTISRPKAQLLLYALPADFRHVHFDRFKKMTADLGVSWDAVVSYEVTGIRETGYDLSVPGFETFMASDGIILSNTMSFIVPVSKAAVRDAYDKMLPDRNLISVGTGKPHYSPTQEPLEALYIMTKPPKAGKPVRRFGSVAEMKAAYKAGEIDADDPVEIRGAH
jgi:hypothetical protein